MTARITLVLAVAQNGVIGMRGAIPWRIADDMKRFKALTMGKPIVMGRKTWDSLPRKPLPGRTNIVVTRDPNWRAEGAAVAHSLDEALARDDEEIAVIGGAEIYRAALPRADVIELTEVHADFDGDAHMPPFDPAQWRETAREDHATPDGLRYSYVRLERTR
ncbi:MAG TPA: dihydrofolate reductase [Rhizomicrobium sp.]|jgi:dihydrofolate reductase|nr:dihydrofolate reductase [Rhizomicrobium sp.]